MNHYPQNLYIEPFKYPSQSIRRKPITIGARKSAAFASAFACLAGGLLGIAESVETFLDGIHPALELYVYKGSLYAAIRHYLSEFSYYIPMLAALLILLAAYTVYLLHREALYPSLLIAVGILATLQLACGWVSQLNLEPLTITWDLIAITLKLYSSWKAIGGGLLALAGAVATRVTAFPRKPA